MTDVAFREHSPPPSTIGRPKDYLHAGHTLRSWLFTVDHKRIGILYLISITGFFVIGSVAAGLVRLALVVPDGQIFTTDTYNKLFTIHGVVMVWFFLIPSIPATMGNFLLPLMIGTKDVAFPRLNLTSWYVFMTGAFFTLLAVVIGGVDTGWTFYAPFSTTFSNTWVVPALIGVIIVGFSSILTGLNFVVTVHTMRAPGMGWFRMPIFVWTLYATSLIFLLATPVITMALILLVMERAFGIGVFDPALGGDPVLFEHLFWFYSHPAVYIMVLPGMGVISEIVPAFSHKKIFGYRFICYATIALASITFFVWGHHMFVNGQSAYASLTFSFLSFAVAVPSAVKVYNWTATIHKGDLRLDTPMLFAMGYIGLFVLGGLTGLFLATLANRRARPRHLFRGGAFPLHHGGRHHARLPRRAALLVAEVHRSHVQRGLGSRFGAADLPRLQRHLLPAVHPRLSRHAAALPRVSARVPAVEHPVLRRLDHPRRRLHLPDGLPPVVSVVRQEGAGEPLGRAWAGVDDIVAAADA